MIGVHTMKIPTYDSMMNPLLKALHDLGGSGTNREIDSKVIEMLELPEGITEVPHGDTGSQSEVEYRLAWTKTYLKKYGLLENSGRGVWALVEVGGKPVRVEPQEVIKAVREKESKGACPGKKGGKKPVPVVDEEEQQVDGWKAELLDVLVALHPAQFERLTQRLLRECGFTQVEVTGKTGDGGIDGKGIIKIRGAAELSCHVSVQTVPRKRRARHGS
jgi:restriction system protein